jgi:hypothetical protein
MEYTKETRDKIEEIIKEEKQKRKSKLELLDEMTMELKFDIHKFVIDEIEEKSFKWGFFSEIAKKCYMFCDYQKTTIEKVKRLKMMYHSETKKINEEYENNIKIKTSKIIKDVESNKNNVLSNIVKLGFNVFMFLCFCTVLYLCNN